MNNCFYYYIIETILEILLIILPLLIAVAYLTLLERKVLAAMQQRRGPTLVGYYGLLQPLADGLKLFCKETIFPTSANLIIFLIAPILTFILALLAWAAIPIEEGFVLSDINLGVLYILAISGISVYGIIAAGWASNTKYAFLGALRSAAQMISYEVSMGLIILCVLCCAGSLNFSVIVFAQKEIWFIIPLWPLFLMFFISILAETNRAPFDLPEAEAELVAGYNVEYSAMTFALFFLGEYANMILMCSLSTIFFFGGWLSPISSIAFINPSLWFGFKTSLLLFTFIWVRATFPRYRYDQLMRIGWKIFLPLSLAWLILIAGLLSYFDGLPK